MADPQIDEKQGILESLVDKLESEGRLVLSKEESSRMIEASRLLIRIHSMADVGNLQDVCLNWMCDADACILGDCE